MAATVASSKTSPCSIESTPAASAMAWPVGVIEWAATLRRVRCAWSTIAVISSTVKLGRLRICPSGCL